MTTPTLLQGQVTVGDALPELAYPVTATTVVLGALAALYPWELGTKADAFASAPAGIRPEWYFLAAFQTLSRLEGIIPALESAHAVAEAIKLAPTLGREKILIVNLSGRGDKDVQTVAGILAHAGAGKP